MLAPAPFTHATITSLLDQIGPQHHAQKERLAAIDIFDKERKKYGVKAGIDALRSETERQKFEITKMKLLDIAGKLNDYSAGNRIKAIVNAGNKDKITALLGTLEGGVLDASIRAQRHNEESIIRLAKLMTRQNPENELKVRRRLRVEQKQAVARLNMHLRLIGHDGYHHATPYQINLRDQQKDRHEKWAGETDMTRDGQKISMADIMQEANKKRVAEVYALSKGLENYATAAGLTWAFITLTAPGAMHPNPEFKHADTEWDGTEPDAAHKWIHKAWRRAEARLRKNGIIVSGVRVVEPHLDSCPHWHILIFAHAAEMSQIEEILRQQPGWKNKAGCKFVENDGRATAASYLFKYVLKSISSIEKLEGEAASVDAWRSTWRLRSIQWFGMPPVGLWRRLRSLKECPQEKQLGPIWRAARRGDGRAFIGLAGGLNIKKTERPISSKTTIGDETKTITFEIRDTGETVEVTAKKWIKERKVEVIPNYPSKATPKPETPKPTKKTTRQPWKNSDFGKNKPPRKARTHFSGRRLYENSSLTELGTAAARLRGDPRHRRGVRNRPARWF